MGRLDLVRAKLGAAEGKSFDKSSPTLLIAEVHFTFSAPVPPHFSLVPERVSLSLLMFFFFSSVIFEDLMVLRIVDQEDVMCGRPYRLPAPY